MYGSCEPQGVAQLTSDIGHRSVDGRCGSAREWWAGRTLVALGGPFESLRAMASARPSHKRAPCAVRRHRIPSVTRRNSFKSQRITGQQPFSDCQRSAFVSMGRRADTSTLRFLRQLQLRVQVAAYILLLGQGNAVEHLRLTLLRLPLRPLLMPHHMWRTKGGKGLSELRRGRFGSRARGRSIRSRNGLLPTAGRHTATARGNQLRRNWRCRCYDGSDGRRRRRQREYSTRRLKRQGD